MCRPTGYRDQRSIVSDNSDLLRIDLHQHDSESEEEANTTAHCDCGCKHVMENIKCSCLCPSYRCGPFVCDHQTAEQFASETRLTDGTSSTAIIPVDSGFSCSCTCNTLDSGQVQCDAAGCQNYDCTIVYCDQTDNGVPFDNSNPLAAQTYIPNFHCDCRQNADGTYGCTPTVVHFACVALLRAPRRSPVQQQQRPVDSA